MDIVLDYRLPTPFRICPACHEPFESFLRGQVARFGWFGLRRRIWCVICRRCKEIVGYEEIRPGEDDES